MIEERWRKYWFRPARLFDLAVCRVVIAGFQLYWLLSWSHEEEFRQLVGLPDFMYDPLPVLHALMLPFEGLYRPSFEVLEITYWVAVVAGVLAVVGLLTNLSMAVFATTNVLLRAFSYSFGDAHHPEALVMISLAVLALSPCGRVLSVDRVVRRLKARWPGVEHGSGGEGEETSILTARSRYARWPLLVIGWLLAFMYLSATYGKLADAGLDWLNGFTLQYWLFHDAVRFGSDVGFWLAEQHTLTKLLSWLTVLFEGSFFLVMFFPALAILYVPAGLAFHTGIFLAMKAPFFGVMALYCVLVPWGDGAAWVRERYGSSRLASILPEV